MDQSSSRKIQTFVGLLQRTCDSTCNIQLVQAEGDRLTTNEDLRIVRNTHHHKRSSGSKQGKGRVESFLGVGGDHNAVSTVCRDMRDVSFEVDRLLEVDELFRSDLLAEFAFLAVRVDGDNSHTCIS